jgi:DNA-binding HxlR family transcriptional regulator
VKRTPFAQWPCPIARTVDLLGDWWTPLVLREAYYGVRRFDEMQRVLQIGRSVLTQRLNRLVEEGLLTRELYQQRPDRHEYVLTDKGRDFYPVVLAMAAWGDRWLNGEAGQPIVLHHTTCDHPTEARVVCAHCAEPLELGDVKASLGPGYPARLRQQAERLERFA